jgi:hypothetical protein
MRYLLVLALLTSCTPLYLPATRNAPLFDEQGEAQVSGYLSAAGAEVQGAYALTDNIAITGNYAYANQKKTSNGVEYTRKNGYAELGLGFYNTTRSSRWEIIGGYGFGESTSSDVYYFVSPGVETLTTAKLQRIFIQPSIGTNNRGTNFAFTPKISWVDFSDFTTQDGVVHPHTENAIIFLEPAITMKFHLAGNIFGIAQVGVAFPISGEPYFKYQQLSASLGIQIDTGGLRTRVY